MGRLRYTAAAVILLAATAQAENAGSPFGALSTAEPILSGDKLINIRVGIADLTSVAGAFGFGLSRTGDVRLKIGVIDDSDIETSVSLGAEAKWRLMSVVRSDSGVVRPEAGAPFDLALGPLVEWFKADPTGSSTITSQSVLQVGLAATGSYPVRLNKGGDLTPYGRLNARIEWISTSVSSTAPAGTDTDESQLALGLNLGVAWRPARSAIVLFAEFQLDGNDGLFLGLDYLL